MSKKNGGVYISYRTGQKWPNDMINWLKDFDYSCCAFRHKENRKLIGTNKKYKHIDKYWKIDRMKDGDCN